MKRQENKGFPGDGNSIIDIRFFMFGRGGTFDTTTQVADTIMCALNRLLQYGPHSGGSGAATLPCSDRGRLSETF